MATFTALHFETPSTAEDSPINRQGLQSPPKQRQTKQYPFSLVYCTFTTSLKHPTDASISNIMSPQ